MRARLLLSICALILHVSCEIFTIPVHLNTQSNTESYVDNCDQLTSLGKTIWDDGGFSDCVSLSLNYSKLDGFGLSYNITVNSDKIRGFQKNLDFMETLAVVNMYLNYNRLKCTTHTGPNWDLKKDDEAQPFNVMAEVSMTGNQYAATYCEYLYKRVSHWTDSKLLRGCNISSAVFSKNGVRQLFALQLRRNASILTPSSNLLRVMQQVSNAINQGIPGCVNVTSVVMKEDCSVASNSLQFVKQINDDVDDENWRNTNGCNELKIDYANAYILGRYKNCRETEKPRRENHSIVYSVAIQNEVNSNSKGCYHALNEIEISLRVEAQFNSKVENCITYRMNPYQLIHDDNVTANLYGPLNASLCDMFQDDMMYRHLFDSCTVRRWRNATSFESLPALYRLGLKQPIYVVDLPLYNKWLSSTLMTLNLPHSHCKFNGYVGRIKCAIRNLDK